MSSRSSFTDIIASLQSETGTGVRIKRGVPDFRIGDTIKVHARIVEGAKERIQIFEGVVIKRTGKSISSATFTVRKVTYGVGVERTFLVHSPRVEKIEIVDRGVVRRAKLYYLRQAKGKAAKVKKDFLGSVQARQDGIELEANIQDQISQEAEEKAAEAIAAEEEAKKVAAEKEATNGKTANGEHSEAAAEETPAGAAN